MTDICESIIKMFDFLQIEVHFMRYLYLAIFETRQLEISTNMKIDCLILFLVIFGTFFVAYLAAWPFYYERRRPAIGPTERHGADGDFAQLSQGVTHYKWVGPTRGPVAVVVHGLASPMPAMEAVAAALR